MAIEIDCYVTRACQLVRTLTCALYLIDQNSLSPALIKPIIYITLRPKSYKFICTAESKPQNS